MKKKSISWSMRLVIFCIVLVGLLLLGIIWWTDGISPVDKNDHTKVLFVIKRGESVQTIANRLSSERLIRSRIVFFLLLKIKGLDNRIQAGDFEIKRSMSAEEIAEELQYGAIDVWVTTLEGWRKEEIAAKLAQEVKISEREFIALAKEGYMFPDTYLIPKNASAGAVVAMLQANFDRRVPAEMRAAAQKQGLTFEEVIILASLVEREGKTSEDKAVIAGILLNRLRKNMTLDVDATLQYALGYNINEKTWWKKGLTNDDKNVASPYNTYRNPGLPPGPIANPGLASITAVLHPVKTDYYFYLHDPKGNAHYAKTLKEHEENIAQYLK